MRIKELGIMEFKLNSNLRIMMEQKRLSVGQLSLKSGVPSSTIYSWFDGRVPKNLLFVRRVALALDLTIDGLCFGALNSKLSNGVTDSGHLILFEEFLIFLNSHDPGTTLPNRRTLPSGSRGLEDGAER